MPRTQINIEKPPPQEFEVRAIIWRAQNVPNSDMITKMNDLFVKAWLENMPKQETDTHWRCAYVFIRFCPCFEAPVSLDVDAWFGVRCFVCACFVLMNRPLSVLVF